MHTNARTNLWRKTNKRQYLIEILSFSEMARVRAKWTQTRKSPTPDLDQNQETKDQRRATQDQSQTKELVSSPDRYLGQEALSNQNPIQSRGQDLIQEVTRTNPRNQRKSTRRSSRSQRIPSLQIMSWWTWAQHTTNTEWWILAAQISITKSSCMGRSRYLQELPSWLNIKGITKTRRVQTMIQMWEGEEIGAQRRHRTKCSWLAVNRSKP